MYGSGLRLATCMNLHQWLSSVTKISNLCLQDETRPMIDLLTFFETTCSQVHACQAHLLGLDTCNIPTARCSKQRAHRSSGEQIRLFNLAWITALCCDHLGQFCHCCTGTYRLLHTFFSLIQTICRSSHH